jgi:MFS family permease
VTTGAGDGGESRFWSIAITLMFLSVMSYLDRQILALLVPDLHRDLGLTDLQIGTLIGPAFMFTYLVGLVVSSFVVDRFDKVTIIVCGTIFWALMTFASAFATSYGELLVLRAGLALGEAMLGPAATALIGDLFVNDRQKRLKASAFFLMGAVIGASGSSAFSAFAIQIASHIQLTLPRVGAASEWRLALILVSLPAFLLALILLAIGGRRRAMPTAIADSDRSATGETLRQHLRSNGVSYLLLFAAVNIMLMVQVSTFIWGPSYLIRRFAMSQVNAGYLLGGIALLGGITGTLTSTLVLRRWAPDGTLSQFVRLILKIAPIGMTLLAAAMIAPSLPLCVGLLVVALFVLGILVTFPMQYLQSTAPAHLKGRVAVGMYIILYFLTSGMGPLVPPALAQFLSPGSDQLGRAIAIAAVLSTIIGCTLVLFLLRLSRERQAIASIPTAS